MRQTEARKKKQRQNTGLHPGAVVFTGNQKVAEVLIHHLQYDGNKIAEQVYNNQTDTIVDQNIKRKIDWYDIRGLHDTVLVEAIGKHFELHALAIEDIVDTHQRPKFDEYEKGCFIIAKALTFNPEKLKIGTEQIALYFRKGLLISFQETESDIFKVVRLRLYNSKGRIRQRPSDYLAYALLDNLVDNYYLVFDEVEAIIEYFEENLIANPNKRIKGQIHSLRKELLVIRKSVVPLREAISQFSKSDSLFINDDTNLFIRDLYDHTIQIMDMIETYRDMLNGLQDLYLSEISFKMNEIMKVLTLITTIFVPLSFFTGLYGMNFDNMPELHYQNGYFILLAVMLIITIGFLILFRYKKWL